MDSNLQENKKRRSNKIRKIGVFLSLLIFSTCMTLTSCNKDTSDPNTINIYEDFPDQNIPPELCGTWREVLVEDYSYFISMTINHDGKVAAIYRDVSKSEIPLIGKCYYYEKTIRLYYEEGALEGEEFDMGYDNPAALIIEWSSSTLILVEHSDPVFFSRSIEEIPSSYIGTDRPSFMIGDWRHSFIGHALTLDQDGTGIRYYIDNEVSYVKNWFVKDMYFYIKNEGTIGYEIYRIVELGDEYYLYLVGNPHWIFQKE